MAVDMKERIAASFAALAQKKPVDKITVKELVELCGISRQTFYYHFQDLLEVMQCRLRESSSKLWKAVCTRRTA